MPSILSLITETPAATVLNTMLDLANALGLSTTTWRVGDPSRTLFTVVAERLATYEQVASSFIRSGFLDYAEGDWLTEHAAQRYGVIRNEGSAATTTVRLTNTGGAVFVFDAGDITIAKDTDPDVTYHNTTGGTLTSLGTLDLEFIADRVGSDGSADVDEITTMVTTFLGVAATNLTSAVGSDEESDAALRERCRASLAALSPNGPADAYRYVALSSELTGTTEPTRVNVEESSTQGHVNIWVTSEDGDISSDAVDAVEEAILLYATPLTVTPIVAAATPVTVNIEYGLDVQSAIGLTQAEIEELVEDAITAEVNSRPIGGDDGVLARSVIIAAMHRVSPYIYRATLLDPAADVELDPNEVAVVGTITAAEINLT